MKTRFENLCQLYAAEPDKAVATKEIHALYIDAVEMDKPTYEKLIATYGLTTIEEVLTLLQEHNEIRSVAFYCQSEVSLKNKFFELMEHAPSLEKINIFKVMLTIEELKRLRAIIYSKPRILEYILEDVKCEDARRSRYKEIYYHLVNLIFDYQYAKEMVLTNPYDYTDELASHLTDQQFSVLAEVMSCKGLRNLENGLYPHFTMEQGDVIISLLNESVCNAIRSAYCFNRPGMTD